MSPLFSIVMPTRNRGHLLQYAVQSAIDQNFDDCEIVVSDNSSGDNTKSVVKQFEDRRLRYARTDTDLSMPDSWDFALTQARGRYVTFLCDDDAAMPFLLNETASILESEGSFDLLAWPSALYFYPNWFTPELRNQLHVPATTEKVLRPDSGQGLKRLFGFHGYDGYLIPRMLNSMASQNLLNRIAKSAGRVFLPPAPDFGFAASALAATDSFLVADRILLIGGAGRESIGASHLHGDKEHVGVFVSEFKNDQLLPDLPLPLLTVSNLIAQTLLNTKRDDACMAQKGMSLDMPGYFIANFEEIRVSAGNGFDVSKELELFWEALRQQPQDLQNLVRRGIRFKKKRRSIRRIINSSRILKSAERACRPTVRVREKSSLILDGSTNGFEDILGSIRRLRQVSGRRNHQRCD